MSVNTSIKKALHLLESEDPDLIEIISSIAAEVEKLEIEVSSIKEDIKLGERYLNK